MLKSMNGSETRCVLLADSHHGMSEGVRGLLATKFDAVVMVADEASLLEAADRMQSNLAVVDLALSRGNALELVRRLRSRFPRMKIVIVSLHDQPSVSLSVLKAGADGFVVKRAIATELLATIDTVLSKRPFELPEAGEDRAPQ
ncbi:response regulator [Taklimakanibacter deserti]|uniref:response regulator n=1 Tax=Taklimakanibacter deserti TaxID=2267839 RepID=UPI000E64DCD3